MKKKLEKQILICYFVNENYSTFGDKIYPVHANFSYADTQNIFVCTLYTYIRPVKWGNNNPQMLTNSRRR